MMKYPNLFSPITIRGVTYPNRIFSAPMTFRDLPGEGDLTSEAAAFYELRAMGGAAEVTVSELTVHGQTGRTYPNNTSADSPSVKVGLAVAADSIRRHGAVPCVELNHGGKFSVTREMWGPSEYDHPDGRHVNEMSHEMIRFIVEEYARAAALVRSAGFRSLLIHGGHGWLLHQFLSPCDNFRTDKYGGSLKNRSRLALEILEAVRGAVGDGFPIEMRVSAEEYRDGGYAFDDLAAFAELIQDRVDLLQISTGSHENSCPLCHRPRAAGKTIQSRLSPGGASDGAGTRPNPCVHVQGGSWHAARRSTSCRNRRRGQRSAPRLTRWAFSTWASISGQPRPSSQAARPASAALEPPDSALNMLSPKNIRPTATP